jgi:hypothetical protein
MRDYLLLAISAGFVAGGIFLVHAGSFDVGIISIVFFGACGIVPILRRRRRESEAGALAPIALPADGTLRPLRRNLVMVSLAMLVVGLVLLYFGAAYPALMRAVDAPSLALTIRARLPDARGSRLTEHSRFS